MSKDIKQASDSNGISREKTSNSIYILGSFFSHPSLIFDKDNRHAKDLEEEDDNRIERVQLVQALVDCLFF